MELHFFFHRVFHGLNALQKHCLWWQQNLHISPIIPISFSHLFISLCLHSRLCFVFFCHLFLHLFSSFHILYLLSFLLLSSFLSIPFQPSLPLLLFSPIHSLHPPSCTVSGFSGIPEFSSDWISQGNVLLDCQVSFLKTKPVMVQPALPRCGVNFKAMGFSIASASLRQDPLF